MVSIRCGCFASCFVGLVWLVVVTEHVLMSGRSLRKDARKQLKIRNSCRPILCQENANWLSASWMSKKIQTNWRLKKAKDAEHHCATCFVQERDQDCQDLGKQLALHREATLWKGGGVSVNSGKPTASAIMLQLCFRSFANPCHAHKKWKGNWRCRRWRRKDARQKRNLDFRQSSLEQFPLVLTSLCHKFIMGILRFHSEIWCHPL